MSSSVALVSDAAKARVALTPLRRELLERLHEPGSASSLAGQLAVSRQKLGYHLRVLEPARLDAEPGSCSRSSSSRRSVSATRAFAASETGATELLDFIIE